MTVNQEIVLTKLHFLGIHGATASLFRSYLTHRKQKIEIKSWNLTQITYSDWETIGHGVPQESILGPLLFLIYRNYLHHTLNTSSIPIIFADDTSGIIYSKNLGYFYILSNKMVFCKQAVPESR